jgi:hypothetical protein
MILLCTKHLYLIHVSHYPIHRKMYIHLLIRCHLRTIWPPLLRVNLSYSFKFLPHCPERTFPIHTSNIPGAKSHVHFLWLGSFIQRIRPGPRLLVVFRKKLIFYGEELLGPRPPPKLEDHPLSAVRDCLFNIFASTLQNWRESPPSATWGRAMPWWQGTHLTWSEIYIFQKYNNLNIHFLNSKYSCYVRPKFVVWGKRLPSLLML